MEKFKAVEKEMKTKAFSKEGLLSAAKQDPKEREKADCGEFLTEMVAELDRQVETLEAEEEALGAIVKKGKKDNSKAERGVEIQRVIERHRWHQEKLEMANRALENGSLEVDQINPIKDEIKYYVTENQSVDFMEGADDEIYDDLNLDAEAPAWGMNGDLDKVSSQDNQSVHDDEPETIERKGGIIKQKSISLSEGPPLAARRPSNNFKSPLPALATLHTPASTVPAGPAPSAMKPAPPPTRPPGETLKYASAAAAAAASEKTIAPLPPAPGPAGPSTTGPTISALPAPPAVQKQDPSAPASTTAPANDEIPQAIAKPLTTTKSAPAQAASSTQRPVAPASASSIPPTPQLEKSEAVSTPPKSKSPLPKAAPSREAQSASPEPEQPSTPSAVGTQDDHRGGPRIEGEEEEESIYHLPPGLQELMQSFEMTRTQSTVPTDPLPQRMLNASFASFPDTLDSSKPSTYRPANRYKTPSFYPQEPVSLADDPAIFSRVDTDTLFYLFYYRQQTYLQYAAAKSLKNQSWRFHKQYQTWFQRHEEPKMINDEAEQGTYRFFDYESTWYVRLRRGERTRSWSRHYPPSPARFNLCSLPSDRDLWEDEL